MACRNLGQMLALGQQVLESGAKHKYCDNVIYMYANQFRCCLAMIAALGSRPTSALDVHMHTTSVPARSMSVQRGITDSSLVLSLRHTLASAWQKEEA